MIHHGLQKATSVIQIIMAVYRFYLVCRPIKVLYEQKMSVSISKFNLSFIYS